MKKSILLTLVMLLLSINVVADSDMDDMPSDTSMDSEVSSDDGSNNWIQNTTTAPETESIDDGESLEDL